MAYNRSQSLAQGPLLPTQRVEFPHLDAYVEMRGVHWPSKVGYEIEYGTLRFGHRGTWGRGGIGEASETFHNAIEFVIKNWRPYK